LSNTLRISRINVDAFLIVAEGSEYALAPGIKSLPLSEIMYGEYHTIWSWSYTNSYLVILKHIDNSYHKQSL
jgi:hypothetical protein